MTLCSCFVEIETHFVLVDDSKADKRKPQREQSDKILAAVLE